MKNEIQTLGIILKICPLQENTQKVTILCDKGLITFFSYGTQKSLKRAKLYPLLSAFFLLQTKKSKWTLLEFHSAQVFDNVAKDLCRFYSVCLLQEIALHSYASQEQFPLFMECCQALNTIDSQLCIYVLIQFWWRWLAINGQQPSLDQCSLCNKHLNERLFYAHLQENFLCLACSKNFEAKQLIELDQGIKNYLIYTHKMSLIQTMRRRLTLSSLLKLVDYLYPKVENILKWKVKSWEEGRHFILPSSFSNK